MRSDLFKLLGAVATMILALLIFSQGLWLWQQLKQEKEAFILQLEQELKNDVSLHTLNLFGKNTEEDSFIAKEISAKELSQAPPSKVYRIDTKKYPQDKSILQKLEAAFADVSLSKSRFKLPIVDSLFSSNFSDHKKIQAYRMQLLKNGKLIDSLHQGNAWINSPTTIQVRLPLGTKKNYVFAADFQLETLPFLRQMLFSIGISALAIILVAFFMLWLLWALQQQAAQLQWREKAVSGIVHDLKSPLSYVYTFLDYLASKEQQPAMQEQLRNASSNISKLTNKMEVLLTLFRSKKKKIVIEPSPYNLAQKCRELLSELEVIYQEKKVAFKLSVPDDLKIEVDPLYFEAALRNLLDNAFKYSDTPAKLTFTTIIKQKELHICIADSGKGIPQKEQNKIFQEFYRADKNSKGHGIGLAFSQQIIKAHKGRISLESEIGKGSTFCIILPTNIII